MSILGTYLVNGAAGNQDLPGAPLLNFSLIVAAATGKISGHAVISQAIAPPYDEKPISNITGQVYGAGLGGATKLVVLKGTYLESLPPPLILMVEVPFEACFAVSNDWTGQGWFSCGKTVAENVPVRTVAQ